MVGGLRLPRPWGRGRVAWSTVNPCLTLDARTVARAGQGLQTGVCVLPEVGKASVALPLAASMPGCQGDQSSHTESVESEAGHGCTCLAAGRR